MTAIRTHLAHLAVLLVFLLATPLAALADGERVYLPAGSIDAEVVIGPPPPIGSTAFEQEMQIVLWLQRTRTPEQVAFVEEPLDLPRFVPILGASLLQVDGLELQESLDAIIDEVRDEYDTVKAVYDLPRPFQVDDRVHPVGDARPVASYPSGHAIRAVIYARMLSEIFPEHRDALTDFALQIGYGRVIAGVHYPSDVIAGQKLANAMADVIVEQDAFKAAILRITGKAPPSRVTTDD
jgi:membrane-associated phospholipid phosphatase